MSKREQEAKPSCFFALLDRMRLIQRWGLMYSQRAENVQEHSLQVAFFAHALAHLRQQRSDAADIPCPDPEHVAVLAMFHDVSEVLTGDLPTPIKYLNDELQVAYQTAEKQASAQLLQTLPESLQAIYHPYLLADAKLEEKEQVAWHLVKAADRLSALFKCVTEERSGNREFLQAKQTIQTALKAMNLPEVESFLTYFAKAFELSLDQLREQRGDAFL